jgi:hypothetical protein
MLKKQEWKMALIEASVGNSSATRHEAVKDLLMVRMNATAVILGYK